MEVTAESLRKKKYHPKEAKESLNSEESLAMFRRMCLTRYFELEVAKYYNEKTIHGPVYLSIGQESISAAIATVISGWYILAQHRAHSVYLAFGGDMIKLIDELLGMKSGCSGGLGGSPSIQDKNIKMIGHHGLIGENVPLAVGVALGAGKPTVCFFGDAAAEEDYVFSSMGFAQTHKLPILFVCEDNNLSILTPKSTRRSWELADVAKGLGMPAVDITDDPWLIAHYTREFIQDLPAFINVRTCRHYWHVGVGVDNPPEWDRLEMVREQLHKSLLGREVFTIEAETKEQMEKLWKSRLQLL